MKIGTKRGKNFMARIGLFALLSMAIQFSANADIVQNLYEIEMPVEGQGREERQFVTREALKEILVRVSGKSAAAAIASDEALVPRPTRLVQQFRYRKYSADEIIPASPDGAKPYTQKLWLRFTESAIAKLLLEQLLPVWGKSRPATLLWLVVDDQKQRILVGNNTAHVSRTFVEKEASRRGLPVRLPLLDLADQARVQVTDVWANFEDIILEASKRYQTEAVLVGRIYRSFANTWHTRWSIYLNGQRQNWETSSSVSLESAVNQGIAQSGELLSTTFAQVKDTDANNTVLLKVTGISDLKSYNQAIQYVKNLNIVEDVHPYQVNSSDVIFYVTSHSGRLGLAQAISLGRVLVVEENIEVRVPPVNPEEKKPVLIQPDLVYKLIP